MKHNIGSRLRDGRGFHVSHTMTPMERSSPGDGDDGVCFDRIGLDDNFENEISKNVIGELRTKLDIGSRLRDGRGFHVSHTPTPMERSSPGDGICSLKEIIRYDKNSLEAATRIPAVRIVGGGTSDESDTEIDKQSSTISENTKDEKATHLQSLPKGFSVSKEHNPNSNFSRNQKRKLRKHNVCKKKRKVESKSTKLEFLLSRHKILQAKLQDYDNKILEI